MTRTPFGIAGMALAIGVAADMDSGKVEDADGAKAPEHPALALDPGCRRWEPYSLSAAGGGGEAGGVEVSGLLTSAGRMPGS